MHETETAEPARSAPQASDLRNHEVCGVADDELADEAVPRQQHADLSPELARDRREVPAELRRDDLARRDAPPEGALERLPLRGLDASQVAVDLLYGLPPDAVSRHSV